MMRGVISYLMATFFIAQTLSQCLYSEVEEQQMSISATSTNQTIEPTQRSFTPFTGRVSKNKVRIRLQPTLDAPILREINKGDLFLIVGENEDFYAIVAPTDVKGYIFRTYVLDNVVEGNRVNVRLEPNLEAPIIAQLQSGEKVDGQISASNNKWLEITPPNATRFYIAKDYIEKIGDASMKAVLDKKKEEGTRLLNSTFTASQNELLKPWNQIEIDGINNNLNRIISDYSDFPELQSKAKELLSMIQESYLQKKMDYLEALSKSQDFIHANNQKLSNKIAAQEQRINELEQNNQPNSVGSFGSSQSQPTGNQESYPADRMNYWIPVENQIYEDWADIHENQPISSFYDDELQQATTLKGMIQLYNRSVRNKPGDYVLLNPTTHIPIAFLYSTVVNLQDYAGKEVTVKVSPRNNNNFAYPAYFVLAIE